MFKLIKYFFKETLISFYQEKDKFFVQKRVIKKEKILSEEIFEFEKDEFLKFINISFMENTQTYISTIIDTFNQGIVNSCNHSKYKELGINIDNIKILCLKDFSVFIGLYELNEFKKEITQYKVDFIFSPYLIIQENSTKKDNTLYILISNNFASLIIYKNKEIIYSNTLQLEDNSTPQQIEDIKDNDSVLDDIDDLVDDIDDLDSLDDDLDDLENIDDIDSIDELPHTNEDNINSQLETTKNELNIVEFIKNSIKDYYENYEANFLEQIEIMYNKEISNNLLKTLKDETLLEIETKECDLLSNINNLALKEINV